MLCVGHSAARLFRKELISRPETLAYFQQDNMTRIVADAGPSGLGSHPSTATR